MGQLTIDFRGRKVVKSNQFIKARYDWSVLMHRVVMMMIAQLEYDATSFEKQRVYVSDLLELTGVRSNAVHAQMKNVAKALLDQKIEVEEGNDYVGYNLLSDARYVSEEGCLEARFNPHMRPFLLELRSRYTQYEIAQAMQLSSPYAVRLFEYAKMMEGIGWATLSVKALRQMLCLEDKYSRFSSLKARVLEPACEEVEEKCSTYFTYSVQRDGQTPVAVRFRIKQERSGGGQAKGNKRSLEPGDATEDAFEAFFAELPDEEKAAWREQALATVKVNNPGSEEGDWWLEAMAEQQMRQRYEKEVE